MTAATIIAVAIGGALGSVARYLVAVQAARLFGMTFPWGTLFVNVTGSFLIGAFAESFALRWDTSQTARAFLIIGICGGYTTFSSFSLDVATLIGRGESWITVAYMTASVVLSIAAFYAALPITRAIVA